MLRRAAAERSFQLMFLKIDRSFDKMRDDQEFQKLLKKIGFPE
jgi:hypothetical protein